MEQKRPVSEAAWAEAMIASLGPSKTLHAADLKAACGVPKHRVKAILKDHLDRVECIELEGKPAYRLRAATGGVEGR
ncbi:MAG: hypothetical protein K2Q09_00985 [Phycisphaerales bacterium]|nr:hypothetical protein [Phycisphaerales bacterium]